MLHRLAIRFQSSQAVRRVTITGFHPDVIAKYFSVIDSRASRDVYLCGVARD